MARIEPKRPREFRGRFGWIWVERALSFSRRGLSEGGAPANDDPLLGLRGLVRSALVWRRLIMALRAVDLAAVLADVAFERVIALIDDDVEVIEDVRELLEGRVAQGFDVVVGSLMRRIRFAVAVAVDVDRSVGVDVEVGPSPVGFAPVFMGVTVSAIVAVFTRMAIERVIGLIDHRCRVFGHTDELGDCFRAKGLDVVVSLEAHRYLLGLDRARIHRRTVARFELLVNLDEVLVQVLEFGTQGRDFGFEFRNPRWQILIRCAARDAEALSARGGEEGERHCADQPHVLHRELHLAVPRSGRAFLGGERRWSDRDRCSTAEGALHEI